jgi:hypothetical protein
MHASTLCLAMSIPTTTKSFCAIIQLPSFLGPGSKPIQLFGLRKTPDLYQPKAHWLYGTAVQKDETLEVSMEVDVNDMRNEDADHVVEEPLRPGPQHFRF